MVFHLIGCLRIYIFLLLIVACFDDWMENHVIQILAACDAIVSLIQRGI